MTIIPAAAAANSRASTVRYWAGHRHQFLLCARRVPPSYDNAYYSPRTDLSFGPRSQARTHRPDVPRLVSACRTPRASASETATAADASQAQSQADTDKDSVEADGDVTPTFEILYQDEHLVAIDKPSGLYVHPPEDGYHIPDEENTLVLLKRQLGGRYLYPLHRLDRPTSGVLLFGLTREAASGFGAASRERRINKTYVCMCRGYAEDSGAVHQPLDGVECTTLYENLGTMEVPLPIGAFPTARYSLLKVKPVTGHYHQIRRHLNRISRPIVGDTEHGDRAHNRMFAGPLLQSPGLFLKCTEMALDHPVMGPEHPLVVQSSSWEPRWQMAFEMFGFCPLP